MMTAINLSIPKVDIVINMREAVVCCQIYSKEDENIHIAHNQYHGCWLPVDARNQNISS